jgi:putative Ca2+/H+ antiporter (TMEM165/GDT1 family)
VSALLLAAATAFILIIPIELPDKTFVATLMLTTRYRPLPVWLGTVAAFGVQCAVAAGAGTLISLLPENIIEWVVAVLFAAFAVMLFRGARARRIEEETDEAPSPVEHRSGWRAFGATFLVLFAAEWGDLSQIMTAGLVAKGNNPFAVFVGSWLGLITVSGAAVLIGRALLKRVRPSIVTYVAAALCGLFAVITAVAAA